VVRGKRKGHRTTNETSGENDGVRPVRGPLRKRVKHQRKEKEWGFRRNQHRLGQERNLKKGTGTKISAANTTTTSTNLRGKDVGKKKGKNKSSTGKGWVGENAGGEE